MDSRNSEVFDSLDAARAAALAAQVQGNDSNHCGFAMEMFPEILG